MLMTLFSDEGFRTDLAVENCLRIELKLQKRYPLAYPKADVINAG